jgi:hypothetical protein
MPPSASRTDVIKRAIKERNMEALRILSVRGGLETSALRREAWPLLLGLRGGGADSESMGEQRTTK